MQMRNLDRLKEAEKAAIRGQAAALKQSLAG
jgi:hypothetical protein